MKSIMLRCPRCGRYTFQSLCPLDGEGTKMSVPPRYSPHSRLARYRRALLERVEMESKHNE